jgi:hypothetical protein
MKIVNDKELAAVIALPGADRYGYFVRQVADWEEIWTLRTSDGFVLVASTDERQLVPVWPHRRFAEAFAEAQWKGAEPAAIPLEQWLQAWTSGMNKDDRGIAVFPVPSGQGIIVTPDRLHDDLSEECSQYE